MRRLVLHPFLGASYFVLFLFAQNLEEDVGMSTVYGPLLFVLGCTLALFGVLWLLLRNAQRAGVLTTIVVILVLSYGHVEDALGIKAGTGGTLLPAAWAALAIAGIAGAMKAGPRLPEITMGLNLVAGVLVVINLVPIVASSLGPQAPALAAPPVGLSLTEEARDAAKRDIYYIIFDRYANERTLKRKFGYDNGAILRSLENKGFYVAHDSVANHPTTGHSLASSLNITYLNYLEERYGDSGGDKEPLYSLLKDPLVPRYLESLGYRYHHIGSWWGPTSEDPSADVNYAYGSTSEFSSILLETTLLGRLMERFGDGRTFSREATEARRVPYQLEKLLAVEDDPGPTFTFAHFLLPHPPYVFDENGNFVQGDELEDTAGERYIDQLRYANKMIEEITARLLDGPEEADPIIVIQSDEGPQPARYGRLKEEFEWTKATRAELREKLLILNAYYLPGVEKRGLHRSISPVNTFRLIFNLYFSADLPLLEDRSWVYKSLKQVYRFTEVTEKVRIHQE